MSQKSASPTPQYVLDWADNARHGNALRYWIRPRYWEPPRGREEKLRADFGLALSALDRLVSPESEMVRTGAWALLETHSNAAADEFGSPIDATVNWLLRAVLLPARWEHVPHKSKGQLQEDWQQTIVHAKLLRRDLQIFAAQVAYKHPGLVAAADLIQLHQLMRASPDPSRWQAPRMDHSGFFGGYRAQPGDETLLDLLNVLIAVLDSKIAEDRPPSVALPSLYEKERSRREKTKPPSNKKTQPLYMRRNFFLKSLRAISEGQDFAFDANLIAACAYDLLVAVGDTEAAEGCTAKYVRQIFK